MKISFTGHREFDESGLVQPLKQSIIQLCDLSPDVPIFYCGMAVGFDIAAAEAVLELRRGGVELRVVAVVPFKDQAKYFATVDQRRYEHVLSEVDEVVILSEDYDAMVYHRRNDYLVEQAELIVAYYDESSKGGTHYTVKSAKRKKKGVVNLHPNYTSKPRQLILDLK